MNKILKLFGIKKTYNKKRNTTFYYAEKYNFIIRITSKIGFYIGTKDNTGLIFVVTTSHGAFKRECQLQLVVGIYFKCSTVFCFFINYYHVSISVRC